MRKTLLTPLIVCMVAFLSIVWMPTVSAARLLRSEQVIYNMWYDYPDPDPRHINDPPLWVDEATNIPYWAYWSGRVDFGGMTGTAYFASDPTGKPAFTGKTYHFYEDLYIAFDDGGWILGKDDGVYNYLVTGNWMYMANGLITDASQNYEHMIGAKYFEQGFTNNLWELGWWDPIIGIGFCFLAPG